MAFAAYISSFLRGCIVHKVIQGAMWILAGLGGYFQSLGLGFRQAEDQNVAFFSGLAILCLQDAADLLRIEWWDFCF